MFRNPELGRYGAPEVQGVSVVIPCLNESGTIARVVERVVASVAELLEVIIVDDGSSDDLMGALRSITLSKSVPVVVVRRSRTGGKGAAVRAALSRVSGRVVVIQDADLEYEPADINAVAAPVLAGQADACFGWRQRARGGEGYPWQRLGNWLLTEWANWVFGTNLRDLGACYKAVRSDVFRLLALSEPGFSFDAELVGEVVTRGYRHVEAPIWYASRSYREGKKLRVRHGVAVASTITRFLRFKTSGHCGLQENVAQSACAP